MAREIELNRTKSLIVIKEVSIDIDKISIDSVTDNGDSVTASISFFNETGYTKSLLLWEGNDYSNIGQWTDNDVNNRILELI